MNNNEKMPANPVPPAIQNNPEWCQLYGALLAFEVSSYEAVPLSFKHRLMREHGWTETYMERVWFEYKRFLFMLATTESFICPAEDVDQIWHTHLIYTRSYWNDLCQNLIGKPLHHVPSRGGKTETSDFYRCYATTLECYQTLFAEAPPPDIWVKPDQRLQDTPYFRLINTRTHWVISKPSWLKPKWLAAISLGMLGLASQTPNVYANNDKNTGSYWPLYLILGAFLIILIKRRASKCPECKKWGALKKTGEQSNDTPPTYEHFCKFCGHTVWLTQDSGGGCSGGGSGGSGGGCGGSGG
ncbi:glycine-rich domain-containing protein-like [uncultured Thiothrix sp.]|uniref:glycine-rich domain-containing protein n=1 Tax=uncultured Thiothrix sp. TaxID=223185 RepID=UPI002609B579|nr:glycine-rich domain-containing protein-like [uncultured Thiothrix sp.]